MTYSAENLSPSFRPVAAPNLRTAVVAMLARISFRRRVQKTIRELSALEETALRDIGLDRSQILQAARHAALTAGHRVSR